MKHLPLFLLLLTLTCCKDNDPDKTQTVFTDTLVKSNSKADRSSDTTVGKLIKFNSPYNFETFKAKLYTGKIVAPDFRNDEFASDEKYVKFITEGCKNEGINFGGYFTIIERFCGALCSHIFIVDRITGKIHTDIRPNDGRYGYLYKKDSYLLIANSGSFQDDSLKYYVDLFGEPELYVWKHNNFELLK